MVDAPAPAPVLGTTDKDVLLSMRDMASHPVSPSTRMTAFSLRPKTVAMATASTT